MAYDSSELSMVSYAPLAGAGRLWIHKSADATATADGAGFITDGGARGMLVGDFVIHTDITATDGDTTLHRVMSVSSTYPGAVDLSEGTVINAGVIGD